MKPRLLGEPGKPLSVTEQLSLIGGDGKGRDVDQRRFKRNNRPIDAPRLSGFTQKVQRNGLFEAEGAGECSPELANVTHRSKRPGDVVGEGADVGALGDSGGQGDLVLNLPTV